MSGEHTPVRGRQEARRHGLTVTLGRVAGVRVDLDLTLLVFAALLTWLLATTALPETAGSGGVAARWIVAAAASVAFIACVLAHELAHVLVARRYGVDARSIRLWLLGGISSLEGDAPSPRADFEIAVVGPATSGVLAVLLLVTAIVANLAGIGDVVLAALVWLAMINAVLAVFNMLPGAPLDGGRALRAWLWKRSGDRRAAAVRATRAGVVLGWCLVFGGAVELLATGTVGGLWLVLVGWFVIEAARAEEVQTVVTYDLRDVTVHDVMTATPVVAPSTTSVEELLHDYVLRNRCSSFPLVDATGRVEGLVTLSSLKRVPVAQRATTPVGAIAWPLDLVTRASPAEPLLDVIRRTTGNADGRVLVFDDDRLVGVVSPSDVARVLQQREVALGGARRAA